MHTNTPTLTVEGLLGRTTVHVLHDSGPRTAVLLHGFPDTPASLGPFATALVAAGLAERVLAPTLPGFERATALALAEAPSPIAAAATHLAAVLDSVTPAAALVVGHDWGGVLAQLAAREDTRDTVISLAIPALGPTLANLVALPPISLTRRILTFLPRVDYMAALAAPQLGPRLLAAAGGPLPRHLWRRWSPDLTPAPTWLRAFDTVAAIPACRRAISALYRDLTRPSTWRVLAAAPPPALAVLGADDGCMPRSLAGLAGAHPTRVLGGVGHFLHLEAPDAVCRAIASVAATVDGPPVDGARHLVRVPT
jgi:pimeloyl-ACP methyl ester carboxylesterase